MKDLRPVDPPVKVTVADGRVISINQVGRLSLSVLLCSGHRSNDKVVTFDNVYHVPTLTATLISVSQLVNSGHIVRFADNQWTVQHGKGGQDMCCAREVNGVYEILTPESAPLTSATESAFVAALRRNPAPLSVWHRRLGHLNLAACRRLASSPAVRGVVILQDDHPPACKSCALAKVTTAPAPSTRSSPDEVANGVCHLDLSGPVKRSYHGNEFFLVAVWRDYLRVYGLKSKSEASTRATEFLRFVERQAGVAPSQLKTIRTDGGTEFINSDFRQIVAAEGLRHQHTTRYRSSQNGVAERAIRTLTEMACAMLIESRLPHYLWEDALHHAAYIRNRVPKRGATITPHERLLGSKPTLAGIPVFGQTLVVRTPEPHRRKILRFNGRGSIGGFVGFSEEIRGYKVYIPGDGRPIKESTDVAILDSMLVDEISLDDDQNSPTPEQEANEALERPALLPSNAIASTLHDTGLTTEAVEAVNGTSDLTRRRRSERISARAIGSAFLCLVEIIREPLTVAEARRSPQWPHWEEAIRKEIHALRTNNTFVLVDPPPGAHVLNNTVQFRIKTGPTGAITQYKARVCARGDTQIYLLDYVDTRAPVADLICVRIFFILVAKFKLVVRQGDVPAAYLKAELRETVYVRQVKGFEEPGQENRVWLLQKALYGLKQAGRQWNREIDSFLKNYGLKPTTGDECIYYLHVADGLLLVCLYVDDILVAHQDEVQVLRLMTALSLKYQVKDMGTPIQFLGVRVDRVASDEIHLSQSAYIDEALHRFAMQPARPMSTPMMPNTRLDYDPATVPPAELEQMKRMPFRQVVGSLLYLARVSRPDIAFAVNQLSRHCAAPCKAAWLAAKHLLRYLAGTQDIKLTLKPSRDGIDVVTDADFANDRIDRKSVSGFIVYLFGAPVAWGSTKQSVVAQSSTSAEFIAANDGLQQADWIQLVIAEILQEPPLKLILRMDSVPAIHRIKREGSSNAQKAVDIRFHGIKDAWTTQRLALEYVATGNNPADLLTKSLNSTDLKRKRGLCGLS